MVSGKSHALFVIIYLLALLTKTTGAAQAQIVGGTIVKTITLGIVSERPSEKIEQYNRLSNMWLKNSPQHLTLRSSCCCSNSFGNCKAPQ